MEVYQTILLMVVHTVDRSETRSGDDWLGWGWDGGFSRLFGLEGSTLSVFITKGQMA